jgi:hypothetical protein
MGVGFKRRYTADPGLAELLKIEGVVIIDNEAPATIAGGLTGLATCIGEFEDGGFEPFEVTSSVDFLSNYGGFGFAYAGVPSNNPCARGRKADSAVNFEYWNGNGFIALANKKYNRLVCVRVDTRVGTVLFSRLASISGADNFNWNLEPGQVLSFKVDGGAEDLATYDAAAPLINSAAGTYPTTFAGGESITFIIDGTTYTAVFLATDTTQAAAVARMNAAAGGTPFSVVGGGVTRLTGRIRGTGGNVRILSVSAVLVTTATGFSAGAAVAGTGDVANIDQVTDAEIASVLLADVTGVVFDRDADGNARFTNTLTPLTGTLEVGASTTATALGLTIGTIATAATGEAGVIPAGTRVSTGTTPEWVTMQSVAVSAGSAGPYRVPIRHSLDDGTGAAALTAAIDTVVGAIEIGAFSVINDLPTTVALTEAQLDAAYLTAIDKTKGVAGVTKEVNLTFSARQSNAIRNRLRQNGRDASANGCDGRVACISPPLGTTRAQARSTTVQPGVGPYRSERVVYAYPGATHLIPQIAVRGLAGGAGFTVDGLVDTHFDSWAASVMSQLPPEQNPGQETPFLDAIVAVERNNADVQSMDMQDYVLFKAAGIAALRIDGGTAFIQSGVTSVDPVVNSGQVKINRRRFADYIQDNLAPLLMHYVKKVGTPDQRAVVFGVVKGFMMQLKNGPPSRIEDYGLDAKSGNTPDSLAAGVFRILLQGRMHPDLDVVVLDVTVGQTVTITLVNP